MLAGVSKIRIVFGHVMKLYSISRLLVMLISAAVLAGASTVPGVAQESGKTRLLGAVTAVNGNVISLKTDTGSEASITVADGARVLQMPAGAKSLSSATPITVGDIHVGDRLLAAATASPNGTHYTATTVVAMNRADVSKTQEQERQDWQQRGINGLVQSVDPAADTITIRTGGLSGGRQIIVQCSKSTVFRRYAPDSVKFDDARPSSIDQIRPGDQLRARGDKNTDNSQVAADQVITGTFRNIAGTVTAVNPAADTITVNDLATKRPFIVHVTADTQLHRLPAEMAQMIAARLKSASAGNAGGNHLPASNQMSSAAAAGPNRGQAGGSRGGAQQIVNRAPSIQISDLKQGEAVMVLTTEGTNPGAATGVTLLAGVEPLLQASPSASQSVLSASWNVGGQAPGQDAQ